MLRSQMGIPDNLGPLAPTNLIRGPMGVPESDGGAIPGLICNH
ncbi:unnamed protein product [Brassica oleracea var. botrytis]